VQLSDYYRIISKRLWIIILAAVLGATGAFVLSRVQTPEYRSTIYLNVWPSRLDLSLQQTIKGLMRNYAGNITSRATAATVINRLQISLSPEELRSKLTVRPIEEDFLLQIDVDDADPLLARDIAQTTAEVFVENIQAYMLEQDKRDRVEVSIRDYALPGYLHKPKWKIYVFVGGLLGLLAGTALVFVLRWLEADIIRSSDDLERQLNLAVLGVIPEGGDGLGRRR